MKVYILDCDMEETKQKVTGSLNFPQNCCCPILKVLALKSNGFNQWNVSVFENLRLCLNKYRLNLYHSENKRSDNALKCILVICLYGCYLLITMLNLYN